MNDETKSAIRVAMLQAQSEWLDLAETAEHPTGRTIALVIAEKFGDEADKYKVPDQFRTAIDVAAYDNFANGDHQ